MKKLLSVLLALALLTFFLPAYADGSVGFERMNIGTSETWAVYSAPSVSAWRSGQASLSTGDSVWYAGFDNGWLLVAYPLSSGGWRIGYVSPSDVNGRVSASSVSFSPRTAILPAGASVSDDVTFSRVQATVGSPMTVTLLGYVTLNGSTYPYIETTLDGSQYRGFASAIE